MRLEIPDPYGVLLIAAGFGVLMTTVARAGESPGRPPALASLVVMICGVLAAVFLAPLALRVVAIFLTILAVGRILASDHHESTDS